MGETIDVMCRVCCHVGAGERGDGYYYCDECGSQAEDIIQTALDDEYNGRRCSNALRRRRRFPSAAAEEPLSRCHFWESFNTTHCDHTHGSDRVKIDDWADGIGPIEPRDFGQPAWPDKEEDYVRTSYVIGLQTMIQLQTKALVEDFNVSPLICGVAGTIWLRYVASTGVLDDHWANEVINDSESQKEGIRENFKPKSKHSSESFNIHGKRAVMLWYRSLSKIIPLSRTLVITYLACHLAREAVLPTDIFKWSLEGKLPYFTAFLDIEKEFGPPSSLCPLSCIFMFRPSESISLYKLESEAASVAQKIGLELPPVNFYAIASQYLSRLSLNSGKILPSVSQLYEWSMPPGLWLSTNERGPPTRVCVLSMVIVAIRMIYNLNGFGYWEKSFSIDTSEKSKDVGKSGVEEAMELLRHLEERYDGLEEKDEYSKDLSTYLQYCKDVVFAGMKPPYEDFEEDNLIEQLWDHYQNKKDLLPSNNHDCRGISHSKRSRDNEVMDSAKVSKKTREKSNNSSQAGDSSQESSSRDNDFSQQRTSNKLSEKDKAIKRLSINMKSNQFYYIPPRIRVKRRDYLHYVRKRDEVAYTYAAHADYYILLQSCARVAKVDVSVMHYGVMMLERRLGWLESSIDYSLARLGPEEDLCELCRKEMDSG